MDPYERTRLLLGTEALDNLQDKTILIIGLGGVGSYTAEALARLGIKHLVLVDYDTIDITNLNRQILATYETIGMKKVDAMEQRIRSISKQTKVTKIDTKITDENIELLFVEPIHYIVDACDTVSVKKELIRQSLQRKIKMISSMGTGNKLNPSLLTVQDIRKTSYDPLAKAIRKMVVREKIKEKIMVISSIEKPISTGSTTISSNSFVPATAGLLAVGYIVQDGLQNEYTR